MWKYKKKRGIYESEPDGLENWVRGSILKGFLLSGS